MEGKKKLTGLVTGLVAIIAVAVFMILGFTTGKWYILWTVFLAIPLVAIIGEIITGSTKRGDALIGLIAILAVIVFVLLGFYSGLWYIAWVVFLAIPITAILVNIVRTARNELGKSKADSREDMQE